MFHKRMSFVWILIAICILVGCNNDEVQMSVEEERVDCNQVQSDSSKEPLLEQEIIYVYVCGRVMHPGVYKLNCDARICDALEAAGGVALDGNGEMLNQAEHVLDGQTLYVPGVDEQEAIQKDELAAIDADGRINLNTAAVADFMTLPGIGEAKAMAIVQYRDDVGGFTCVEDLMNIPGIKEGVYNKIKDKVKV